MNRSRSMQKATLMAALSLPAIGLIAWSLWPTDAGSQEQEFPKPGPHHGHLKLEEGVWDATVSINTAPGMPPMVSKGTETNTVGLGGLWLITDFKGEFGGQPFSGHGLLGYDLKKKKYVGVWVDSMQDFVALSEGDCDDEGKTRTMTAKRPDQTGVMREWRDVVEIKGKDARMFTMSMKGDDGKYQEVMKIEYKRQ